MHTLTIYYNSFNKEELGHPNCRCTIICIIIYIFSYSYALAIFDNPNLETLWDFHPDFKITGNGYGSGKGGVFVQLNPRLCLHNVYPLIEDVLKLNRSDPAVDISETTNGNARICKFFQSISTELDLGQV